MTRLLVLEDDAELRAIYRRLLEPRHGVWLWSSREASRLWQLLAQGYRVPEVGGFALVISSPWLEINPDEPCSERLIRALRREFPAVPVIVAGRSPTPPSGSASSPRPTPGCTASSRSPNTPWQSWWTDCWEPQLRLKEVSDNVPAG